MLTRAEIEMLAASTPDELVAHIRELTPRVRQAHHDLKRVTHEFERLACMLGTARTVLFAKRLERHNGNTKTRKR